MDKDKKAKINITNNFNAPIGQHIDHVDNINFRMDGEGNFHFGMVENVNEANQKAEDITKRDEEKFHYVHPAIDDDDETWHIHDTVKRLVSSQKIPEICQFLKDWNKKEKLMLPQNPSLAYKELIRLGMPDGKGYSEKYFAKEYSK